MEGGYLVSLSNTTLPTTKPPFIWNVTTRYEFLLVDRLIKFIPEENNL